MPTGPSDRTLCGRAALPRRRSGSFSACTCRRRVPTLGRVLGRVRSRHAFSSSLARATPSRRTPPAPLKPLTQYHHDVWQTRTGSRRTVSGRWPRTATAISGSAPKPGSSASTGSSSGPSIATAPRAQGDRRHRAVRRRRQRRLWIGTDDGAVLRRATASSSRSSAEVRLSRPISAFFRISAAGSGSPAAIRSRYRRSALASCAAPRRHRPRIYEDSNGALLGTYGPLARVEDDAVRLPSRRPEDVQAWSATACPTLWQGTARRPGQASPAAVRTGSSPPPTAAVPDVTGSPSIVAAVCGSGRPAAWRAWRRSHRVHASRRDVGRCS